MRDGCNFLGWILLGLWEEGADSCTAVCYTVYNGETETYASDDEPTQNVGDSLVFVCVCHHLHHHFLATNIFLLLIARQQQCQLICMGDVF